MSAVVNPDERDGRATEPTTLRDRSRELEDLVARQASMIGNLHQALESRDLIGQAKGLLMAANRCGPDEAFTLLVSRSQRENRKLVDVATAVIAEAGDAEACGAG